MRIAYFLIVILLCSVVSATPTGPEEQAEDRREAQDLVRKAYQAARAYCAQYPQSSQTVTVEDDGIEIEIRVRCEIVNRYFDGSMPSR